MWTIRRSHQHIRPGTLSEYLDRRLQGDGLARVDQQLSSCDVCREELESLRATVTMLRDLPVETLGRSFIMAAPLADTVQVRPSPLLRVPQWVYAGAASVAAIALVVLVSADATGLLAPDKTTTLPVVAAPTPPQLETEVAEAETEEQDSAEPAPMAAAPVTEETVVEQSATPAAMAAEPGPREERAAATAGQDAEEEVQSRRPTPESELGTTPPRERTTFAAGQDEEQVPLAGVAPKEMPEHLQEATGTFWRVLEGLAGALGLVFLAGLAYRWKISRRTGRV